jgi:DNA-binding response OmpR family regulator
MARILVIDDEPQLRTLLEKFLTRDGHEVDLAKNGREGLKLFTLNNYDLVITDVVMPEQDGLEVVMELKRNYPRVRIIVISGGAARLDVGNLLNMSQLMGADRTLPKPLDFLKLQAAVKEVLAAEVAA